MASKDPLTTQMNALVTLYLKLYKEKYGEGPRNFNRHRDKWGFQSMVEDLGYDRAREVVTYYFETRNIYHPVNKLLYEYDKIDKLMREREEDEERRQRLLAESKKRVEAWREANG